MYSSVILLLEIEKETDRIWNEYSWLSKMANVVCQVCAMVHSRDLMYRNPYLAETAIPPDPFDPVSKRRFDGLVKKWRRDLHHFDPKDEKEEKEVDDWFQQQKVYLADIYVMQDIYPFN